MADKTEIPNAWGEQTQENLLASGRNYLNRVKEAEKAPAGLQKPKGKASYVDGANILLPRPAGAPGILNEIKPPIKIVINCNLSPGDLVMLSAAIRDLHINYPNKFLTALNTSDINLELFENNPYITKFDQASREVFFLNAEYDLVHRSNQGPYHFIHGYRLDFEAKLGVRIKPTDFKGDIHLTKEEKDMPHLLMKYKKIDKPYWIINAGVKRDFTTKLWEVQRFQRLCEAFPEIQFIQIGAGEHVHRHLKSKHKNVLNLLNMTTMRELVRLVYHAAGCISPVSLLMHLAQAVPVNPKYQRLYRPCVVLAGGREPSHWEAYPTHAFLHNCGMLPCCAKGGCWKSRVKPIGDGDEKDFRNLCERPVKVPDNDYGQDMVPKCMDLIPVSRAVEAIEGYLLHWDYSDEDPKKWRTDR
jgi:ADP-heptose:LPS heptosyltransferase